MWSLIAAGFAAGWAIAGWRNLPPVPQHYAGAFGMCLAASVLASYYAGTRRKRDQAVAVAVAKAEARAMAAVTAQTTSQAQVFVNLDPAVGARHRAAQSGLDSAPWLMGAQPRFEVEQSDAVDSMLEDAREQTETSWDY